MTVKTTAKCEGFAEHSRIYPPFSFSWRNSLVILPNRAFLFSGNQKSCEKSSFPIHRFSKHTSTPQKNENRKISDTSPYSSLSGTNTKNKNEALAAPSIKITNRNASVEIVFRKSHPSNAPKQKKQNAPKATVPISWSISSSHHILFLLFFFRLILKARLKQSGCIVARKNAPFNQ